MEDIMKVRSLAIAALLGLLAATSAFAQPPPADTRVRLEVVLNRFEGETKTGSVPFLFSLAPDQKGTLRVSADPTKNSSLGCTPSILPATQFVGTQVESTAVPAPAGRFNVKLVFTERALAGCRDVGGTSIPVFSNKIVAETVLLGNEESREIVLKGDPQRNESTRVSVTLMVLR
jgi:hypothetical protein